jgi:hypothetical protein
MTRILDVAKLRIEREPDGAENRPIKTPHLECVIPSETPTNALLIHAFRVRNTSETPTMYTRTPA